LPLNDIRPTPLWSQRNRRLSRITFSSARQTQFVCKSQQLSTRIDNDARVPDSILVPAGSAAVLRHVRPKKRQPVTAITAARTVSVFVGRIGNESAARR